MAALINRVRFPLATAELDRRWAQVRALMRERKIEALVIQGANNYVGGGGYFRWFSGLSATGTYPSTLLFPAGDLMTLLQGGPFGGDAKFDGSDPAAYGIGRRMSVPSFPAVSYTWEYDADLIARAIKHAGYRTVGIVGPDMMYYGFLSRLRTLLSAVDFADPTEAIDLIKADKSEDDIVWIRKAAEMQDEIFAKARAFARPGLHDYEVFTYSEYVGDQLGSETGYFIGSSAPYGEQAWYRGKPYHGRKIREGDVMMWQAENTGPAGWFVHMARFFVFGRAPQELIDAFGAAVEAQKYTLSLLQPGTACRDVFAQYQDYMRARNLPVERRLHCHGQGYENVERPLIRHDETMTVAGNMNIGIHPAVTTENMFMTVCDNFLLHAAGPAERLHKTPQELFEVA
jgi:Xaa-Pro aminopeptidase